MSKLEDLHPDKVRWLAVADRDALHHEAAKRICEAATVAISHRGQFVMVLAGGNTPRAVYQLLRHAHADWPRWHLYFSDERCLPVDDAARNSRMADEAWLRHVAIPDEQIHVIPAERGAHEAAVAYTHTLRSVGEFDLVLLGLGEDGHTASLFPGNPCKAGVECADAVAVFNAPKPPTRRVSLSAARLSHAHAVLFLVTGEAKRHAVAQWRAAGDIPARAIHPPTGVDVLLESGLLAAPL